MFFETYISLCTQIEFSAIILTGGQNSRNIIIKEDASYCNLPNFPALDTSNFIYHSQNGFVTCGGSSNPGGCYTFTNGQWVASHSLTEPRRGHLSWQTERVSSISSGGRSSESGILLFGGVSSSNVYLRSAEFVSNSSSSTTLLATFGDFTDRVEDRDYFAIL